MPTLVRRQTDQRIGIVAKVGPNERTTISGLQAVRLGQPREYRIRFYQGVRSYGQRLTGSETLAVYSNVRRYNAYE